METVASVFHVYINFHKAWSHLYHISFSCCFLTFFLCESILAPVLMLDPGLPMLHVYISFVFDQLKLPLRPGVKDYCRLEGGDSFLYDGISTALTVCPLVPYRMLRRSREGLRRSCLLSFSIQTRPLSLSIIHYTYRSEVWSLDRWRLPSLGPFWPLIYTGPVQLSSRHSCDETYMRQAFFSKPPWVQQVTFCPCFLTTLVLWEALWGAVCCLQINATVFLPITYKVMDSATYKGT